MQLELKRVVVTGLGAITPLGKDIPELWNNLLNGVSGAAEITRFDTTKFKTRFACEVKNYNAENYFEKKEARKIDLFTQYALIATDEAIEDSQINLTSINLERAGVIWASGIGGLETYYSEHENYYKGDGTPRFSPFFVPKMIIDIAAGYIAIKYRFKGVNFATVSACASSSQAIIDSFNYIRLGKADLIISGGSEASINPTGVGGFNAMHALSTRNDDPKTASRPFDLNRDGFVLGEGGCALIVEELEHAKKRGAKIYAEIIGAGMTCDAYHITAPDPDGDGAYRVMKCALEDENINPSDVDYINTHGTSTQLNDITEAKAIVRLFGEHAYKMNLTSSKSMTGHLLGGAGAIESIITILSIKNDVVTPTINHFTDDPQIPPLNFTFNVPQKRPINIGLNNSFGFGGHNTCIAFKKYQE